jgi:L-fuculose-phosphate aldolase
VSASIDRLRSEVAHAGRSLAAAGVAVGVAGNVSARAGGLVAVSPTGARLSRLTADEVAVVDLDGRLVDAPRPPTSELRVHLAIYRRFGAAAVVHTHPPMATAVACVADALPCFHYALLALGGDVRVARYATFGTAELADSVVEALAGRSAALMGNHGAVTYGDSLQAAIDATELLEWACCVYVHARACGTPRELSEGERRAVAEALAAYRLEGRAAPEGPPPRDRAQPRSAGCSSARGRGTTRPESNPKEGAMSTEAPPDEPLYEIWIDDTIHSWKKDTISVAEIRELGGLPADCPMSAVDLVAQQEVPLPEDAVHSVPPRELGRPLVKRTHFKRLT